MDEDCIKNRLSPSPNTSLIEKEHSEKKEAFLEIKSTTAKTNN